MSFSIARFGAAFALLLLLGCSGGAPEEEVPPLQPVSGKVALDGKPASGVSVSFVPSGRTTGNGAYGTTDAAGSYTLQYRTGDPGIPAGEYIVLFSKMTQPDGSPIPEGKTSAEVQAVEQLPEQYRSADRPLHRITVPEGGKTFDFELKSR